LFTLLPLPLRLATGNETAADALGIAANTVPAATSAAAAANGTR
jgi:hypothetical protein